MQNFRPSFSLIAALIALLVAANLAAGGGREEASVPSERATDAAQPQAQPQPEPEPQPEAEAQESTVPQRGEENSETERSPAEDEPEPRSAADESPAAPDGATVAPDSGTDAAPHGGSAAVAGAELERRIAVLEAENERLRELLSEAQFMLTLFAEQLESDPARTVSESMQAPRSASPPAPEVDAPVVPAPAAAGTAGLFALPEGTTGRFRNDERFVLIRTDEGARVVDAQMNRTSGVGVYLEIDRTQSLPVLELVFQWFVGAGSEGGRQALVLPAEGREIPLFGRYLSEEGQTGEQVRVVQAVGPEDRALLNAILSPDTTVALGGATPLAAIAIGEAEREALRRMLYLYRELGGEL